MNSKARNEQIDVLKGVAILLVVLGHTLQSSIPQFDDNLFFRIIYAFHMPFFFFLSGWVFSLTNKSMDRPLFVWKKVGRLLVPFIIWYFPLSYLINFFGNQIPLSTYLSRIVFAPDYGLWFLLILFFIYCVFFVVHKLNQLAFNKNNISEHYLLLVSILIIQNLAGSFLGVHLLKWHILFFYCGYLLVKFKYVIHRYHRYFFIFSLLFIPLVLFWRRNQDPYFAPTLYHFLKGWTLKALLIYKYTLPLFGIALATFIIRYISKSKKFRHVMSLLGKETLGIYAINNALLRFWHFNDSFIAITCIFLAVLALSYFAVKYILRLNIYVSFLTLGEYKILAST